MAVVTVTELKNYMSGINLNSIQEQAAEAALQGAQDDLELYLNRSVETVHAREMVQADETGFLYLTKTPVLKIISVTTANTSLGTPFVPTPIDAQPINPAEDMIAYDVIPNAYDIRPGGIRVGGAGGNYIVEYIGGGGAFIAPYLGGIKQAILRVAAREVQTMHDDTMSLRNTSAMEPTDPVPIPAKGWTEAELKKFDRLRRRVVV